MNISDDGIIDSDDQQELIDSLEQVFFHLAAKIDESMLTRIADDLDADRGAAAARALVSIAVARNLAMSRDDRQALRRVHEAHGCDLKQVDLLDARAADGTPTAKFTPIRAEVPSRTGASLVAIDSPDANSRRACPSAVPARDELTAADARTTKFMPVTPPEPPTTKFAPLPPPGANSTDAPNT